MHNLAQQPTTKYPGVGSSHFPIYLESVKLVMVVKCLKTQYVGIYMYMAAFVMDNKTHF